MLYSGKEIHQCAPVLLLFCLHKCTSCVCELKAKWLLNLFNKACLFSSTVCSFQFILESRTEELLQFGDKKSLIYRNLSKYWAFGAPHTITCFAVLFSLWLRLHVLFEAGDILDCLSVLVTWVVSLSSFRPMLEWVGHGGWFDVYGREKKKNPS